MTNPSVALTSIGWSQFANSVDPRGMEILFASAAHSLDGPLDYGADVLTPRVVDGAHARPRRPRDALPSACTVAVTRKSFPAASGAMKAIELLDQSLTETSARPSSHSSSPADRDLRRRIAGYQSPVLRSSVGQVLTSIGGFLAVCAIMYVMADVAFWLPLVLAPIAAGFLVRTFIVQHDCGHGAFFRSRRLNDALGFACSLLTLAPYASWRRQHAGHHGVWNNLDRRDTGADIYSSCLTVDEYNALGPWRRRWYRISRHPIVANIVLPPLVFMVLYRIPFDMPAGWRRERIAVYLTNVALVALIGGVGLAVGFDRVLEVQLPVMVLASIIGVWLFTVQHRSEHTVWARQDDWTAVRASLEGSTHLRLSRVLRWFTGNIGLHHVHHLNPKIPNYRLQQCHDAVSGLEKAPVVTLGSAFRSMLYVLWDEREQKMVTFRAAGADRSVQQPA